MIIRCTVSDTQNLYSANHPNLFVPNVLRCLVHPLGLFEGLSCTGTTFETAGAVQDGIRHLRVRHWVKRSPSRGHSGQEPLLIRTASR